MGGTWANPEPDILPTRLHWGLLGDGVITQPDIPFTLRSVTTIWRNKCPTVVRLPTRQHSRVEIQELLRTRQNWRVTHICSFCIFQSTARCSKWLLRLIFYRHKFCLHFLSRHTCYILSLISLTTVCKNLVNDTEMFSRAFPGLSDVTNSSDNFLTCF
jgi:hypothetical protein